MMIFPNHFANNKLLHIVSNHWNKFKELNPSYDRPHYNKTVKSILKCADPAFGFRQYMCLSCGDESKIVAFSCKSKFCLRCGRVNGEKFSNSIKDRLHPDVTYRHLVLTMPEQLRKIFYNNRQNAKFFSCFFEAGWQCINDFVEQAIGKKIECGCLIVIHLVGRNGEYKPHLHVLLMAGGIEVKTGEWKALDKFPYKILHLSWQKYLLKMIENYDTEGIFKELISFLRAKYYKGFVARIEAGNLPKQSQSLIKYLSKYLCRPQISQKRIRKYDKNSGSVEFEYRSHLTKRVEVEKIDVMKFLGRLVQQILPKGFQRIRYYGLQASKNSNRLKYFVAKAINSLYLPDREVKAAASESKQKVGYQELVSNWWGTDPFLCSNCGGIMELIRIWQPVKGFVFSLFRQLFGKDIGPPGDVPSFCFEQD